jgi:hypothetical protein
LTPPPLLPHVPPEPQEGDKATSARCKGQS